MSEPACSEEEFIRVHRELQSTQKVADALGVSTFRVRARRRFLEQKHGIVLPVFDKRKAYNTAAISQKAIFTLQIADGTVIVGSDAHIWPGELTTMQRAFLVFAKELKPKLVAANGDFFDGPSISRHADIMWETKPNVAEEIEAVQDYMSKLVAASSASHHVWNFGNHEQRYESRLAAVAPEYRKTGGFHFKDHFPEWIPAWRIDINEDAIIRHRENGGEHADWNNVVKSGKTIVTGHDHRGGWIPYDCYSGRRYGVRCGYMADSPLDPQFRNYLEAKEPNWQPAFVVLTWKNGRLLMPEMVYKWDEDHVEFRGGLVQV